MRRIDWSFNYNSKTLFVTATPTPSPDPCNPSPCGSNALCNTGACSCPPGYFGDPYLNCRLECSTNGECSPTRACQGGKCIDPCPGACGTGATCSVNNHIPSCTCPSGTSGDPFSYCTQIVKESKFIISFTEHLKNCA